jgi:hypothetical protein
MQVSFVPQVPQLRVPLHPSLCMPQVYAVLPGPAVAQVFGVQMPVEQLLFWQVSPVGQVEPQSIVPLQPSFAMPHVKPCFAHVVGVQVWTHAPAVQTLPDAQVPQLRMSPQPSAAVPQVIF